MLPLHSKENKHMGKVKQVQFESLDAFIVGQNNFYNIFDLSSDIGRSYREHRPAFKRFQEAEPQLESSATQEVTQIMINHKHPKDFALDYIPRETFSKMFTAYKIMSDMVYDTDRDFPEDSPDKIPGEEYLIGGRGERTRFDK